ncbi:hypothetical protein GG804_25060 [Sphingomonas histidinilytica]|nr:hypothetical protein [Rhizorhabdus histidinilytica]MBO9380042.1 hypothetical protein [Rhizorhabdus histidinilytica]
MRPGLPGFLEGPSTPSMTGPWLVAVCCFLGLVVAASVAFALGAFS